MTGFPSDGGHMTNSTASIPTTPLRFAPDDPRHAFDGALGIAAELLDRITDAHLSTATPCDAFDVEQLIAHLHAVVKRVAAVGRGAHAFSVPDSIDGVSLADRPASFRADIADAWSVWADDALIGRMIELPWATAPGAAVLGMYVNEVTVHTWDIAVATGLPVVWDDAVVSHALAAMAIALPAEGRMESFEEARAQMPEDQRDWEPPFRAAIPVDGGAPLIDRLVAFNGRPPR